MEKKLYKSKNKKISGVCAGVAEYFNIDPTIVRIIWLVIALCYGIGLVAYIACMIAMPEAPSNIIEG